MSGTDGDGYQSAWRADHARDVPTGDPWAAPMSRSTAPDPGSPARAADAIAEPATRPLRSLAGSVHIGRIRRHRGRS